MNKLTQGAQANYTGNTLERFIHKSLTELGYLKVPRGGFHLATLVQPSYATQYCTGLNIYGSLLYCDVILFHPTKWPNGCIIEAKWQQVGGSVDEKFPFLVANINSVYPCPTLVVLDGGGYRAGSEAWLRRQIQPGKLHKVLSMAEFTKYADQGNI